MQNNLQHKELHNEKSADRAAVKPFAMALAIFLALGVTIANATLSRFGLQDNAIIVFSTAFMLAALLLGQNPWLLGVVALGVLGINQPETRLANFGLDRDVLLAALCALILVPTAYRQIFR